jgi:hypothetical protein
MLNSGPEEGSNEEKTFWRKKVGFTNRNMVKRIKRLYEGINDQ